MFARVSPFEGPLEQVDELVHAAVEKALPQLKRLAGFNGGLTLADRQSGKVLTVLLWESEEAMRASEETSYWFRHYSAEAANEMVTVVEKYEIVFSELNRAQPYPHQLFSFTEPRPFSLGVQLARMHATRPSSQPIAPRAGLSSRRR